MKGQTAAHVPDSAKAKNFKARLMALRQEGVSISEIAKQTGLKEGTIKNWFARWHKRAAIEDEAKAEALMEKEAEDLAGAKKEDAVFAAEEEAEEVASLAPRRPGRPRKNPGPDGEPISTRKADGTLDTSKAERRLETAVTAAARTVRRAAAGMKVEAQSLAAAKLILKKYGLLQEEDYTRESQYSKMSNEELADRTLAAVAILLRKRDRPELAAVMDRANTEIKELLAKQKPLEAS